MIAELTGEYRFLSNFWSCFISFEGVTYPSVENAYQAAKCFNTQDREKFFYCKASEAKRLGRVVRIRTDWETKKIEVMRDLVMQKFRDPRLKGLLLATGSQVIEEGNWWGDTFWGTVNGVGLNMLGKILMFVRDDLRKEKS